MPSRIRHLLTTPIFEDAERTRIASLLTPILLAIFLVSSVVPVLLVLLGWSENATLSLTAGGLTSILTLLFLILLHRGYVHVASVGLILTLWGIISLTLYYFGGIRSPNTISYSIVIVIAGLLLGGRAAYALTGLTLLSTLLLFYAERLGLLTHPISVPVTPADWINYATVFSIMGLLLHLAAENIKNNLEQARRSERARVESQEALLARTRALTASAEVSRRLSSILNQGQLLHEVVEQVRAAFFYYHVQIYLFDSERTKLQMVGGTGETGRVLLTRGHTIPKGQGIVGRAAMANEVIIVSDVAKDEAWLPNPLLPETRAEVAIPITLAGRVLGVLDVQHHQVNSLTTDDVDMLRSIADQVAVALQNTQLYEQAQRQAEQDTLVLAISQKIQYATSVESALQVAVRELGEALGGPTSAQLVLPDIDLSPSYPIKQEE